MRSDEIIRAIEADGWREVARKGSHAQFKHPTKPGRVTVPHPRRDVAIGTCAASNARPAFGCADRDSPHVNGTEMADYIALIHKDPDSDYSVSFPDFPGCITAGETIEEARQLAAEALALHVAGMIEDGQEIPAPSPMAAIMTERENRDAVAFLVSLPERAERHIRIQITMPTGLVREIDERTDNRSKFLTDAARSALRPMMKLRSVKRGAHRTREPA